MPGLIHPHRLRSDLDHHAHNDGSIIPQPTLPIPELINKQGYIRTVDYSHYKLSVIDVKCTTIVEGQATMY